jgi:hypothetical protein
MIFNSTWIKKSRLDTRTNKFQNQNIQLPRIRLYFKLDSLKTNNFIFTMQIIPRKKLSMQKVPLIKNKMDSKELCRSRPSTSYTKSDQMGIPVCERFNSAKYIQDLIGYVLKFVINKLIFLFIL